MIKTYYALQGIREDALFNTTAVVIDALRMTTTANTAIDNGCLAVYTCAEVDEAKALAADINGLLGGERHALLIPGFDFSNSPLEYTKEKVEDRNIVMTTSNGTRAIAACSGAKKVFLGAFINRRAVAQLLQTEDDIAFVCAGLAGAYSMEDALAAGAIASLLPGKEMDDATKAAIALYKATGDDVFAFLRDNRCGALEKLRQLGFEGDLRYSLSLDTIDSVAQKTDLSFFVKASKRAVSQ